MVKVTRASRRLRGLSPIINSKQPQLETKSKKEIENICPVCMVNEADIGTKCNHLICKKCLERIMYNKNGRKLLQQYYENLEFVDIETSKDQIENLIESYAPCYTKCPTCRQMIYLFDLKKKITKNNKEKSSSLGKCYAYEKEYDLSELDGFVFAINDEITSYSLHFTSEISTRTGTRTKRPKRTNMRPYMSFESENVRSNMGTLDDGTLPPKRLYFEPGFHYNSKSKTFYGEINLDKSSWYGSNRWEVIVQFSSNLQFTCGGCIIMHRDNLNKKKNAISPFDGKWTITGSIPPSRTCSDELTIQVVAGAYSYEPFGYNFHLKFASPDLIKIKWRNVCNRYNFNWIDNPQGPDIGETFSWKNDINYLPSMKWTRESKITSNTMPLLPKVVPLGAGGKNLIRVTPIIPLVAQPSLNSNTLWGNVFVQGAIIGLGSYHFLDCNNDGSFISYEDPLTAFWGTLDDGTPLPARIFFRNSNFDLNSLTFCGDIMWEDDFGITWNGRAIMKYEMVFDKQFKYIESGGIQFIMKGGIKGERMIFGDNNLLYENACLVDLQ